MGKTSLAIMVVAVGLWASAPPTAEAGIGACGNIHVEAEAMCELVPPGVECEGMCTPLSVRAACSAELAAECRGGCNELPSVDCQGECTADCMADCDVLEPGEFDCEGSCQADCTGRCEASCEASDDRAACMASCEGSCSASCEGHCDVELPEADCEASCEASCDGSCEVDPNLDCQLECQSEGYAECEGRVEGGCEVACESEEGALFCDSSYVDHGDNLDMCIAALEAALDIEVEAMASGESGCGDQGCFAEGEASASVSSDCAVGAPGQSQGAAPGVLLALLGVLGVLRRRRGAR